MAALLTLIILFMGIAIFIMALYIINKNEYIDFIYEEWGKSDKHMEKHLKENNVRPPFPLGRTIKEGVYPIRPRK